MGENYTINEFGEISRSDYFFQAAKEGAGSPLPTNRKIIVTYLLSFITFGIYGLVMSFAMARETNISCREDGKNTKTFWAVLGLSIITLGIYAIVWMIKWLNREHSFLTRRNRSGYLSGTVYFVLMLVLIIVNYVIAFTTPEQAYISSFIMIPFGMLCWGLIVKQHNEVNKIHNVETFPHK